MTTSVADVPVYPFGAAEFREARCRAVGGYLKHACVAFSFLYAVLAASHFLFWPASASGTTTAVAMLTSLALLGLYSALTVREPTPYSAHPIAALISAMVLINSLTHLYLSAHPRETSNIVL